MTDDVSEGATPASGQDEVEYWCAKLLEVTDAATDRVLVVAALIHVLVGQAKIAGFKFPRLVLEQARLWYSGAELQAEDEAAEARVKAAGDAVVCPTCSRKL